MTSPLHPRCRRHAARIGAAALAAFTLGVAALLLGGCGTSAAPTGSPSSTPLAPTPLRTFAGGVLPPAARVALRDYFAAVAAGDQEAAAALLSPTSPLRADPAMGITAISEVRIARRAQPAPPSGTSALVPVSAAITGREGTPWGPSGMHDFFMALTQTRDGSWLVDHMTTSP